MDISSLFHVSVFRAPSNAVDKFPAAALPPWRIQWTCVVVKRGLSLSIRFLLHNTSSVLVHKVNFSLKWFEITLNWRPDVRLSTNLLHLWGVNCRSGRKKFWNELAFPGQNISQGILCHVFDFTKDAVIYAWSRSRSHSRHKTIQDFGRVIQLTWCID